MNACTSSVRRLASGLFSWSATGSVSPIVRVGRGIALVCCVMAGAVVPQAQATPGIKVLSEVPYDGPIKYTVKMSSKAWGNAQETRTIRSGQSDDFTWRDVPVGGSQSIPDACPDVDAIRTASGTSTREVRIRFAAVVAQGGDADIQLSFQATGPRGVNVVGVGGKKVECPEVGRFSQMLHFTMTTGGTAKTVTLGDGTRLTVSASRK
jgi:Family of unknown function (DUF6013)